MVDVSVEVLGRRCAPSSEAFRSCGTANGGRTGWGSASGGGGKRGARTRTECNFEAQGELVSRCHNGWKCLAGARVAERGITINHNINTAYYGARRIHLHPPSPN